MWHGFFFFLLTHCGMRIEGCCLQDMVGTSYPAGCSKGLHLLWTVAVALNSGDGLMAGHTLCSDHSSRSDTVFFKINPWGLCPVLNR